MKTALRAAAALSLFAAAACAGTTGSSESYSAQMDRLSADCQARGGILAPNTVTTDGTQMSGAPERDYVCKIAGGPSGRLQGG